MKNSNQITQTPESLPGFAAALQALTFAISIQFVFVTNLPGSIIILLVKKASHTETERWYKRQQKDTTLRIQMC